MPTAAAAAGARAVMARRQREARQRLIDEILYDKQSLLGSSHSYRYRTTVVGQNVI